LGVRVKFDYVIKEPLPARARAVVERETDAGARANMAEKHLFHPRSRMQFPLRQK